jgi:hypothetical protein
VTVYKDAFQEISPFFKTGLIKTETHLGFVEFATNRRTLVASGDRTDQDLNRFFSENGKCFGFRLKDCYEIYRQIDGSKLVTLSFSKTELCITRMGGVPILKGLIDRATNKYYPWSMRSLAQLSNEHLTIFYEDVIDEFLESADVYHDITRGTDQIIFGNPMPAFFPHMFKNFKE